MKIVIDNPLTSYCVKHETLLSGSSRSLFLFFFLWIKIYSTSHLSYVWHDKVMEMVGISWFCVLKGPEIDPNYNVPWWYLHTFTGGISKVGRHFSLCHWNSLPAGYYCLHVCTYPIRIDAVCIWEKQLKYTT